MRPSETHPAGSPIRFPWRTGAIAVALSAAFLAVLVVLVPTAPLTGDGEHYVAYARSGLTSGAASSYEARRVLAPFLASHLGMDPLPGFHVVTVAALFGAALCTWAAAWSLRPGTRSLLAVPLFFGTFAVSVNLREYALTDPLAWLFMAAIWLCTVRRWWVAAMLLAGVGALAKEGVFVGAVAAAAAAWLVLTRRQALLATLGLLVPAGFVLLALTWWAPGSPSEITSYVTTWVRNGLGSLGPARSVYWTFASYAALWLLVPLGWSRLPRHLAAATAVFGLAAIAAPFVGTPERMEEMVFPSVVMCAFLALVDTPWPVAVAIAVGSDLFAARAGGNAAIPSVLGWAGLAVAVVGVAVRYGMALGLVPPDLLAGVTRREQATEG